MAMLTNWEAEKGGYFQGTDTLGQTIGRAIDWIVQALRNFPKLPNIESAKHHWRTWPDGEPIAVDDVWIDKMITYRRLPDRNQANYSGAGLDRVDMLVMGNTHVTIEMLNTDRQTRHRCKLLGNVLVANREGWDMTLNNA